MNEKNFSLKNYPDQGGYSETETMNNMIEMHVAGQLTQHRVNKWLDTFNDNGKRDLMMGRLEQRLNCEIEELPEK